MGWSAWPDVAFQALNTESRLPPPCRMKTHKVAGGKNHQMTRKTKKIIRFLLRTLDKIHFFCHNIYRYRFFVYGDRLYVGCHIFQKNVPGRVIAPADQVRQLSAARPFSFGGEIEGAIWTQSGYRSAGARPFGGGRAALPQETQRYIYFAGEQGAAGSGCFGGVPPEK